MDHGLLSIGSLDSPEYKAMEAEQAKFTAMGPLYRKDVIGYRAVTLDTTERDDDEDDDE
jgi:hypothetical protein